MASTFRYDCVAGGGPIRNARSAISTWSASRSASEYTATVGMPSSRHVRITRTAISPRFATRTRTFATRLARSSAPGGPLAELPVAVPLRGQLPPRTPQGHNRASPPGGQWMLGQDSLEHAVRASGIAVPPVFLEETGSTSVEARALADAGAPEWTLVAAGHQTAGRGRMGRRWTSAPGRALLFSAVLRPALSPEDAAVISLLAATEMAAACGRVAGVEVRSEWPNDLVAGVKRKVGGVLTESAIADDAIDYLVLGI